jgi:sporulation protein YabP
MLDSGLKPKRHELKTVHRKQIEISGIVKLESFDKTRFRMDTDCGFLTITGQGLTIKSLVLEQGDLVIEGQIHGMVYGESQTSGKTSFWSKVLK